MKFYLEIINNKHVDLRQDFKNINHSGFKFFNFFSKKDPDPEIPGFPIYLSK